MNTPNYNNCFLHVKTSSTNRPPSWLSCQSRALPSQGVLAVGVVSTRGSHVWRLSQSCCKPHACLSSSSVFPRHSDWVGAGNRHLLSYYYVALDASGFLRLLGRARGAQHRSLFTQSFIGTNSCEAPLMTWGVVHG